MYLCMNVHACTHTHSAVLRISSLFEVHLELNKNCQVYEKTVQIHKKCKNTNLMSYPTAATALFDFSPSSKNSFPASCC